MSDREKLIELIEKWNKDEFALGYASYELADYLIANNVVIQKQGEMDSLEAVDKFRDELMSKFLRLCNYNDFSKLRLEKIADTINDVHDKCIDDLLQTAERRCEG